MKNRILSIVLAVLLVMSVIPFTALTASAGMYLYCEYDGATMSAFEGFWTEEGTYALHGYTVSSQQFDGRNAKKIAINPNDLDENGKVYFKYGEKLLEESKGEMPLFAYNPFKDKYGNYPTVKDKLYVAVEYYYDTTGRDEADTIGVDLTGNTMVWNQMASNTAISGGTKHGDLETTGTATSGIVANKWDTVVIPFTCTKYIGEYLGQYKFYPMGKGRVQMKKGDALYIGSVTITDYDPTTPPTDKVYVELYASKQAYENGTDLINGKDPMYNILTWYTLPEFPAKYLPEGATFLNWVDADTLKTYNPGDKLLINESPVSIYANLALPVDVSFTVGENTTVLKWKTNTTQTLPAAPEAPEGQVFRGWEDTVNGGIYSAGAEYAFGEEAAFTAVFVVPATVYYSEGGAAIDGVDSPIFSSFADADAYLAANSGGIGTIIVNGTLAFKSSYTLTSTNVTLTGYDKNAVVSFNGSGNMGITGNSAVLSVDDIIVARGDSEWDEQYFELNGITLDFGTGCTFRKGLLKGKTEATLNLYIGNTSSGTVKPVTIVFDGKVTASQVAPIVQYDGGNKTLNGNFTYVVNGGYVSNIFLVSRNGNNKGAPSTLNGDSSITVNGGTVSLIGFTHMASNQNGTGTITVNGGKVSTIIFGAEKANKAGNASAFGNGIVVVNAKEILASGGTVPAVVDGVSSSFKNSVSILNNAERVADPSTAVAPSAQYPIAVKGGHAEYVVDGDAVKFKFIPDNALATDVYVNEVLTEADAEGYFTFTKSEGLKTVTFAIPGAALYTVTYSDGNGNVVAGGEYNEGTEILIKDCGFTSAGKAFLGFTYGGVTYEIGDSFTMPAANVEFVAEWLDNSQNLYYVASTGSDSNVGAISAKPFATVNKALSAIGTNTGTIVVMDRVLWPSTANDATVISVNGTVTITGKDPVTGTVYSGASLRRGSNNNRPSVGGTGSLTLEYLTDFNPGSQTNNPIHPNIRELVLGTGYKYSYMKEGKTETVASTQLVSKTATQDMTVGVDAPIQHFAFFDWSSTTYSGSMTLNFGSNAKVLTGNGICLGGDTGDGTSSATISGPTFVNVYNNKNELTIYRGGLKPKSVTNLNGLQTLLVNTNAVIKNHTAGKFNNSDKEYIVHTNAIPEGCDIVSNVFGQVTVTLADGFIVTVKNSAAEDRTVETSGVITLDEGDTYLTFVSNAATIPVNFDDGSASDSVYANDTYVMPARDNKDGKFLAGWHYNGTFYAVGETFTVPSDVESINLTGFWVALENTVVYVDNTNGNDAANGFSAEAAVKTFARLTNILKVVPSNEVTVKVIGGYAQNKMNLPAFDGKLIIDGDGIGSISYGEGMEICSDVEFRNIAIYSTAKWKHIGGNGYNITFGERVVTSAESAGIEGQFDVTLHSGKNNVDMTGDQKIVIKSGTLMVQAGPFYISDGTTKTWNGNLDIEVWGGNVGITFGDGYPSVDGKFALNGDVTVTHKGGTLRSFTQGHVNDVKNIYVLSYTGGAVNMSEALNKFNTVVIKFNGVNAALNAEKTALTFNEDAYIAETSTNYKAGDTVTISKGIYTLKKGVTVASGLTVEGAQIRLDDPQALRFIAKYEAATEAEYAGCEYGFVVLPTVVLNGADLEADKTYVYNEQNYAPAIVPAVKLYDETSEYKRYTAAMTGFTADTYATEYTAVTYIKKGDAYIYGESYSTSIYAIAKDALAKHEEGTKVLDEAVKAYFETIVSTVDIPSAQ